MTRTLLVSTIVVAGIFAAAFAQATRPASGIATAPASASAPASAPKTLPVVKPEPGKLSMPKIETDAIDAAHAAELQKLINGGVAYLVATQEADGSWSLFGQHKPGATAIAVRCLLQHPDFGSRSPSVKKALDLLVSYRQPNGAIYDPKQGQAAYTSAIALSALVAAKDPAYGEVIDGLKKYLSGLQVVPGSQSPDGKTIGEDDRRIGGFDYGKTGEPNMSVTGFVVTALHEAGVSGDDPVMQRALRFVTYCQNSESNPQAWVKDGTYDGGIVYAPSESKAMTNDDGKGLRSYGSMTYTGFKIMIYANLPKDDPRLQGALKWIQKYWRMDSNPNMPQAQSLQGLYYYYQVMAKTLRAWGQPTIEDAKGVKHNWREELVDALKQRIRPDGSWTNNADRWEEGSPILVTSYVVMALQEAAGK
jgi:squalene-hopene/tetraprenyl-beta-curcumene cyclase